VVVNPSNVFLVGLRSPQHAIHSGYEGFRRYVGTHLKPPVRKRKLRNRLSLLIDHWLEIWTKRPDYTIPLLLIEGTAALHMLLRRRCVYHVLYGDSDYWMLGRIGRWTGNAVVATFHEGDPTLEYLTVDAHFTRHLSAVILLCEAQRAYFERFLEPERIFVVPLGIDTGFFRPAPRLSRERVCITIGGHERDFETLGQAIELLREKDPNVRITAIGTHIGHKGPKLEIEDVDYRDGLSDEELLEAYRASALAVFAFNWAGANTGVLEAMACGLPIVATDVGGVSEYVGADAGILCPPRDPTALAAAMLQVLDDPERAAKMGAAARRTVTACDFRVVADQLRAVYTAILEAG
jgi:glycosyltransferase involved in cell wall biosynthesis